MVERFHADPRVQATELLLQERVPRDVAADRAAAARRRCASPRRRRRCRCAAIRSPHTAFPHTQFLSNGNYVTVVTNAGGGASFWRGLAVTRWRRDATRDAGRPVHLPARRAQRRRLVGRLSADAARAGRLRGHVLSRPRDRSAAATTTSSTQLDVAVSTEDDVEVRRLAVANHGARIREIDVTSYAEIVLAPPADDLAHPAFGKLFLETEYLPDSAALLCHRRPRDPGDAPRRGPSTS